MYRTEIANGEIHAGKMVYRNPDGTVSQMPVVTITNPVAVGGTFVISEGDVQTDPLPFDATQEDVNRAIHNARERAKIAKFDS